MVKVFYSPAYVGSGYSFDTTRKAKWIADSLIDDPISGIELFSPTPATRKQVLSVHQKAYVNAVQFGEPFFLAESQGFDWDPGLWPMVMSSNGGAIEAALAALENDVSGSLSSGLHHAKHDTGEGFCTFNGLVIAAKVALAAGAKSVLILDLDAHCGGGTASLIIGEDRIKQCDISVCELDQYKSTAQSSLTMVNSSQLYLPTIKSTLNELLTSNKFDLCLYNAGMDPFESCPLGRLSGITFEILEERENLVFEWCHTNNIPIAFVLAGGYIGPRFKENELVDLHRLTLKAAVKFS